MRVTLRLKELLDERGMSQRQLAKEVGLTTPTVHKMCHNTLVQLPLEPFARICEVLRCEITDILVLEKEQSE